VSKTFLFYDLETSGLSGREDRVMQFAGIRTDEQLQPVGEPFNILVKLADDTLPSPEAALVTGITPQSTQADGLTEAEFVRVLMDEVFIPDTITVGFNNIRFDDEFIRHLLWRNFHDPYEWAWSEGRSRWDMLDAVRMTRALRPDGIKWPVDAEGKPTNRLELLTKANGIDHLKAHDALSDVEALIAVTKLIRDRQPQLFGYLLKLRDKKEVQKLVNLDDKQPFVYSSGRYENEFNKTTVAFPLTAAPNGNVLVYDLRYDPIDFVTLDKKELEKKLYASYEERQAEGFKRLPVKTLQYNRSPAVAPVGVLEQADGWSRVGLDRSVIATNMKALLSYPEFAETLRTIFENKPEYKKSIDPESQLYDSFVSNRDKLRIEAVRNASPEALADFHPEFEDDRLPGLLLHYKARSFPSTLSKDEQSTWDEWRNKRLQMQLPGFMKSLKKLHTQRTDEHSQFILQELQLWAENILPVNDY